MWKEETEKQNERGSRKREKIIRAFQILFIIGAALYVGVQLKDVFFSSSDASKNSVAYDEINTDSDNYLANSTKKAVQQYEMAAQENDRDQMCYKSSMVANLYLELSDKEDYTKWKEVSRRDCGAIGVNE